MIKSIRRKLYTLRADTHVQEVASVAVRAFLLKITGACLAFAFNVAVAQLLGPEGAGIYFLALSVAVIGSVMGRVGLDGVLIRLVATHAAKRQWATVRAVHASAVRLVVLVAGTLSLLSLLTAGCIAVSFFHKPDLVEPLRWMSLSILPFAILNLQAASLKGLKRVDDAMLLQGIGVPLLGLLMIWPLTEVAGIVGASWGYLAATVSVASFGVLRWRRASEANGKAKRRTPRFPLATLWESCRHLWGVAVLNGALLPWLPLFLLGLWSTSDEVGVFGAALRVAMLVSFFLIALINVIAPRFAELYAGGDLEALGRVARVSALFLVILATPVVLPMVFAGSFLMSIFGDEFAVGGSILSILALGQWVNALCGPVGSLLIMSRNESKLRNATYISLILQFLLCIALIPKLGMVGAAIASAVAGITNNLMCVYYVRRYIGIAYPLNASVKNA